MNETTKMKWILKLQTRGENENESIETLSMCYQQWRISLFVLLHCGNHLECYKETYYMGLVGLWEFPH